MEHYRLRWAEVAIDQYLQLAAGHRQLVDVRLAQLLTYPDGAGTSHDPGTDLWTATDGLGAGLIVYVFSPGRPALVVLRLLY